MFPSSGPAAGNHLDRLDTEKAVSQQKAERIHAVGGALRDFSDVGGQLIAIVEFKSQVGPSFADSYNNRTEEALGNATDLWTAYGEGACKLSQRP